MRHIVILTHNLTGSRKAIGPFESAGRAGGWAYQTKDERGPGWRYAVLPLEPESTVAAPNVIEGGDAPVKHYQEFTFSLTVACGLTSYEVGQEEKTFKPADATCEDCKQEIGMSAIRDRLDSATRKG